MNQEKQKDILAIIFGCLCGLLVGLLLTSDVEADTIRLVTLNNSHHVIQSGQNENHGGVGVGFKVKDNMWMEATQYTNSEYSDSELLSLHWEATHDNQIVTGLFIGGATGYQESSFMLAVGGTLRYKIFRLTYVPTEVIASGFVINF